MEVLITHQDKIFSVVVLFVLSFSFRQFLVAAGQKWVSTFAQTATICVLPVITYVITSVISGNIALSLGMVGALSIVRFRNPVKSPFELAVYFTAITMGITASVSLAWLSVLVLSIVGIVTALVAMNKANEMFGLKPLFQTSFSEGNELSTLELTSTEEIPELLAGPNTIAAYSSNGHYRYVLASHDRQVLIQQHNTVKSNPGIQKLDLAF